MRALTVDCVTNRRSDALTKLPAATTDRKVRASSVSIDEPGDVSPYYQLERRERTTDGPRYHVFAGRLSRRRSTRRASRRGFPMRLRSPIADPRRSKIPVI